MRHIATPRTSELLGVVVASGQELVGTPPVSPALAAYQSANVAAGRDVLAAAQAYSAAVQAQSTGQLNATARPMSIAGQELIQAAKQLDALRKQYQVS